MFSMRRYMISHRRRNRDWRRELRRWDWEEGRLVPLTSVPSQTDYGDLEQPELWNAYSRSSKGDRWEDIQVRCAPPVSSYVSASNTSLSFIRQPIGVRLGYKDAMASPRGRDCDHSAIPAATGNSPSTARADPGFFHAFRVGLHDTVVQINALRSALRRTAARPSSVRTDSPPSSSPITASPIVTADPPSCAHVVLAIAMPAQKPCFDGVPLYALGIAKVKWDGGPLEGASQDVARNVSA